MEMDPWVISDVLQPNLESTGFLEASVIHTARVETFLENAQRYLGDYIYLFTFLILALFKVLI